MTTPSCLRCRTPHLSCSARSLCPPEAAEWLRQKFERDCEIGRLRRVKRGHEPDPTFVFNVVLVPKKGAWRECANLVQANGRIKPAVHPVPDCIAVLT